METIHAYGLTRYGVHLPVAITASNRMDGKLLNTMTGTMALLAAPDKIVGRLHYDYQVSPRRNSLYGTSVWNSGHNSGRQPDISE